LASIDETTDRFPRDPGAKRKRGGAAPPGWAGSSVAHYRILEQIGSGGMGVVFRAEDTRLLRTVALKFLPPPLTSDPVAKERFLKEAQAASALDHPNISTVYEFGESAEGQLFLAMACYNGETLKSKIERGPLPVGEAVLLASQVAAGLSQAHSRGIVHRDIKPSNLMVTAGGIVKILDFGIAKLAGREGLTREGLIIGTLDYMSPEQASGREIDPRTDIWSLGVVLYTMLTGYPPFRGENDRLLVDAILHRQPEPLKSLRPEVPARLERLVERMLAKDPDERPQTMDEVCTGLDVSSSLSEISMQRFTPRPVAPWRYWAIGAAIVALVAGLAAFTLRPVAGHGELPRVSTVAQARPSVAVLPFENLSRDAAQDYLADGLTEALTTDLAKISGLKVVSRTSAMFYRSATKRLPQIALELGVDNVLEGSVLRVGNRIRITAQLVEAKADRSVWAESYDRKMRDILELQSEVSRAIVRETQVQLTPQELARLSHARPIDPEVYEVYLKGRYQWSRRNREGIEKAIAYFEQAIAKDPNYAPAYAGLSDAYSFVSYLQVSPEAIPKARSAAQKAVELDDSLPEAHASLGNLLCDQDWDFAGSERELRRALELNPNYATAHHWLWADLVVLGRWSEAQREIELAHELDPLSLAIETAYADQLYLTGRRTAWDAEVRKILTKDPNFSAARLDLSQFAAAMGQLNEASRDYERVLSAEGLADLARRMELTRGREGAQAAFKETARSLAAMGPDLPVPTAEIAWLFIAAGQKDQAFEWLEKSYQQHSPELIWLGVWPSWESLRTDPRYKDLLRRVGLPAKPE
jgi:serine/threonine protein kinase/tetratricopeptide (TPR) repeat protein